MVAFRFVVFLVLSFCGSFIAPIQGVQARVTVNPQPHPTLGLLFAPGPSPNDGSFIEAGHNGSTITPRQSSTNLAAWATRWYPGPVCYADGTCSSSSSDDIPHIKINGDGFTVGGRVFGGIYNWPSNTLKWGSNVNVHTQPGFRNGAFGLQSPVIDCSPSNPSHVGDSYAAAYDWTTARWSPIVWLYTECYTL